MFIHNIYNILKLVKIIMFFFNYIVKCDPSAVLNILVLPVLLTFRRQCASQ